VSLEDEMHMTCLIKRIKYVFGPYKYINFSYWSI